VGFIIVREWRRKRLELLLGYVEQRGKVPGKELRKLYGGRRGALDNDLTYLDSLGGIRRRGFPSLGTGSVIFDKRIEL